MVDREVFGRNVRRHLTINCFILADSLPVSQRTSRWAKVVQRLKTHTKVSKISAASDANAVRSVNCQPELDLFYSLCKDQGIRRSFPLYFFGKGL